MSNLSKKNTPRPTAIRPKRVLLDECLPREFRTCLKPHWGTSVLDFAYLPGRKQESKIAFAEGIFDVFITRGLREAGLRELRCHRTAVITLSAKSNRLEDLRPIARKIIAAVEAINPGEVIHIDGRGED